MTYSFSLNASQLIDMSLKMMNIVSLPDSAQSVDYNYCLNILNMMLKSWSTNPHLWKRKQGALFVSYNQPSYQLGSVSGSDNCALVSGYVQTTSSATSSSNSITLTSVTGMSIGDNIGIELDNLSRFWTTITNIVGNTVTLNSSLTSQATSGNTIITYTSKINRPIEVLRATLLDLTTQTETPLEKLTYDQYFNTPIKTVNGRPVNFYYDRVLNNSLPFTGTLYLYLNPDSSKYIIRFSYQDMILDVVNPTDTLDIPQTWLLAITSNLAVTLAALGYGKLIEAQATTALAAQELKNKETDDSDDEYFSIVINNNSRLIQ